MASLPDSIDYGVWPDPEPEFVSVREAAKLARRTPQTIRRWIALGWIDGHGPRRHGAMRLIRTRELRAFLEDGGERAE